MDESIKIQIAMFRFGIISDFLYRTRMKRGEKERLLNEKSKCYWKIPFSIKKQISRSTIKNWIRNYQNSGRNIKSLYPKERNDAGICQTICDETAQQLIELRKELSGCPVTKLVLEMERSHLIGSEKELKYHNAIRLLHRHGLMHRSKSKETKKQKEQENLRIQWSWLGKLAQGKVNCEELKRLLSRNMPLEDIEVLHECILTRPIKYRNRAVTVLSSFRGIPLQVISDYLLVSVSTAQKYLKRYNSGAIAKLLKHRRGGIRKYENPEYIDALFSVIHSPPSLYGFNRTTWRHQDIQKVMAEKNLPISKGYITTIVKNAGYRYRKAKTVLTSNDPKYRQKVNKIKDTLSNLGPKEKFFSVDEYGPFAVKLQGGRSLMPPGQTKVIPQWQKSKGSLIITAALELSTNQISYFYSKQKNTAEMIKLLNLLVDQYMEEACIYFSWDAASWHASKKFKKKTDEINSRTHPLVCPRVGLVPLPTSAQFLNVIESVFSGMARAIIHNSDYQSVDDCKSAIDRYFSERNEYFQKHPKRAGKKIWGNERVKTTFSESNNCKDPLYR